MSPLWRDQLRVALCPDRLVIAGYKRGLRPRLSKTEIVPLFSEGNSFSKKNKEQRWRPAVDALAAAIAPMVRDKPAVTVILSNHFVRYDLLQWNVALKTDDEWLALARHRLVSIHGQPAEDWSLCVTATSLRGPRLVSATDRALLDAVESEVASTGAAVTAIQPHLMTVYNRIRPPVGARSCWLVIDEPGRSTLAFIQKGAWHAIRSRGTDEAQPAPLADLLERESAILGLDQPCSQVYMHSDAEGDASTFGRYEVRDVTLANSALVRDRKLAMAIG